jgi:hypothetical protein
MCFSFSMAGPSRRPNVFTFLAEAFDAAQDGDDIVMIPPDGSDAEGIDEDAVDDPNQVLSDMAATYEVFHHDESEEEPEPVEQKRKKNMKKRKWSHRTKLEPLPEPERVTPVYEVFPFLENMQPLDTFLLYFSPELIGLVTRETNRYAEQSGAIGFKVSEDDITKFFLVLIYASYVRLPRQEMYWDTNFDLSLSLPALCMSRDRFKDIKRYLHFANNEDLDKADRFAKIQPLMDAVNGVLGQFGVFHQELSVDEQMVRYFGRFPSKQYMKGKPNKWGYKIWVLSGSDGYPYHLIPYQGSALGRKTTPLGTKVVTDMVDVMEELGASLPSHVLYIDNFFTSYNVSISLHHDI